MSCFRNKNKIVRHTPFQLLFACVCRAKAPNKLSHFSKEGQERNCVININDSVAQNWLKVVCFSRTSR